MIRITKLSRMYGPSITFNNYAWHMHINKCTHALKYFHCHLFVINFQPVANMPRSKQLVSYKKLMEFDRNRMIGMRFGGFSFLNNNKPFLWLYIVRGVMSGKDGLRKPGKATNNGKHNMKSQRTPPYGSDRPYDFLPCRCITLDRGYRCIIVHCHHSLTSATPWNTCKDSSE